MTDFEREIEAIKAVLSALEPLSPVGRQSVLDYVFKRLDIQPLGVLNQSGSPTPAPQDAQTPRIEQTGAPVSAAVTGTGEALHIKKFKEQKKPRSANEMAVLVAYYMANLATAKKATINAKDIETQFKIAGYPLPGQTRFTLTNAKNSGYLDAAGDGEYRLNAVGHNLVVHSMPKNGNETSQPRRRSR